MIRINKTQKEIEGLASQVPALTPKQRDWAVNRFESGKMKGICKGKNHHEGMFSVMNVIGDWQVTRLVYMDKYHYVRKEDTPWNFWEVCQAWNKPTEKNTYFRAFPKKCLIGIRPFNPYSLGWWSWAKDENGNWHPAEYHTSELEPRRIGGSNYFGTDDICPGAKVLEGYKRRGLTIDAIRASENDACWLFECMADGNALPMYETLLKGRDYELFDCVSEYYNRGDYANALFSAYKICRRNGYDYKSNFTEWKDLVQMLYRHGLDYHSPHYVCPADLHQMHQTILERCEREQARRETGRRVSDSAYDKIFRKRIKRYLEMDIHNDDLVVVVLPSVKAFKEEGDRLGDCVYRCEYYRRPDSLILSARDRKKKSKRWETIEVDLKGFQILQCYGYGDKFTEKHQEILDLVNANMWQIKACKQGKMKKVLAMAS